MLHSLHPMNILCHRSGLQQCYMIFKIFLTESASLHMTHKYRQLAMPDKIVRIYFDVILLRKRNQFISKPKLYLSQPGCIISAFIIFSGVTALNCSLISLSAAGIFFFYLRVLIALPIRKSFLNVSFKEGVVCAAAFCTPE